MKFNSLKTFFLLFLAANLFFLTLPPLLAAERLSSGELIENAKKYEGREVIYRGEVVGDIMKRGEFAWVHINDDPYSSLSIPAGGKPSGYNSGQSIWLPYELAKKISFTGSYNFQGDLVEVRGRFNAVCPKHGGEMDIHATYLRVLKRGHPIKKEISRERVAILGLLALLFLLLAALKKFKSQQLTGF